MDLNHMRQKNSFDKYARTYHEVLDQKVKLTGGTSEAYASYKTEIVASSLAGRKIDCLLDLGCGDGLAEVFFRTLLKDADIIGLDISYESIAVADERHIERCVFRSFDGAKIPVSDQQADVVFVSCVFHHVPQSQHKKLLSECARVLKSNGEIYIFEHNPLNPVTRKIVRECIFDCDRYMAPILIKHGKCVSGIPSPISQAADCVLRMSS